MKTGARYKCLYLRYSVVGISTNVFPTISERWHKLMDKFKVVQSINQSIHWHVQNVVIPCRSQEPLPFLPVIHFFLPLLSADHSSILPHFIQPSILGLPLGRVVPRFIYNTLLGILFSSILCTCPNQRNLCSLIVSVTADFLIFA